MFYFSRTDKEAPRVDWCQSPPTFLSTDEQVEVFWEEPIFSDNSGDRLQVTWQPVAAEARDKLVGTVFHKRLLTVIH